MPKKRLVDGDNRPADCRCLNSQDRVDPWCEKEDVGHCIRIQRSKTSVSNSRENVCVFSMSLTKRYGCRKGGHGREKKIALGLKNPKNVKWRQGEEQRRTASQAYCVCGADAGAVSAGCRKSK